MPSARRAAALLAAVLLAGACGDLDEAVLVDPGTSPVTADLGELRVLRHHDDPPAGDRWVDVLEADPSVFERTGTFREEGDRTAAPHEPADVRLLYEAVAPGRTLVIRLDCRGCGADGVPTTRPEETELLVWELVADGGGELALGPAALVAGEVADVVVGDHVVVVRGADDRLELQPLPADAVLRLVATRSAPHRVDVFAVVATGLGGAAYGPGGEHTYAVQATIG